jgi:hypothetical protein
VAELKRVHLKMVLVHDPSQENSSIDLLEVGDGWSTMIRPIFLAGLRS